MNEYKPNEEVIKKIAEEIPKNIKTQIQLDNISAKNCVDYNLIVTSNNKTSEVNLTGPKTEIEAGGALLNSAIATIGAAHKMLNVSLDDIMVFLYETVNVSDIKTTVH